MRNYVILIAALWCKAATSQTGDRHTAIRLTSLDAFREPGKNWLIAADAIADYTKQHDLRAVAGEGVVVNTFVKNDNMHLVTMQEFGDVDLELEFMMARGSNSGVYLQGRYEIQLQDSWAQTNPTSSDAGGIYMRWTPERGGSEGTAPLMNVARAPGLWQHLRLRFRAPRFNEKGEKTDNARFEYVYLNGALVQQYAHVTGPTRAAMYNDERAKGPICLQGDHGPIAFRNLRYRELPATEPVDKAKPARGNVNPIVVSPGVRPAFIRTFLIYGGRKLTHVISVGNSSEVNYSYDLKHGQIFQVWRGKFLDVTPSWRDRGEEQLGVPLGSVLTLNDAPAVAQLDNETAPWPDSVAFNEVNNHGYLLDKQRSPTFSYTIKGIDVKDSIVPENGNTALVRTLSVTNASPRIYCRVAAGSRIEPLNDGIYAVNNKTYYVRLDKKFRPVIRKTATGEEMLVRYDAAGPVTYSIIW